MSEPTMESGYTFVAVASTSFDKIDNDDWDTECLSEPAGEYAGQRKIDGTLCNVWTNIDGSMFFAQVAH